MGTRLCGQQVTSGSTKTQIQEEKKNEKVKATSASTKPQKQEKKGEGESYICLD